MSQGHTDELLHKYVKPCCVPGFVLGARGSEVGWRLGLFEEFTALGERDACFELSNLTSICSLHLCK